MRNQPLLTETESFLFPGLSFPTVASAFSGRNDGNMSLCYADIRDSLLHRKDFLARIGIDYRGIISAKQVHKSHIEYVTAREIGRGALSYDTCIENTDCLITDTRNLALTIFSADCQVIFLYDPHTPAVGIVHAGWRGSLECIAVKALARMTEQFKTQPEEIHVGFGPSIRQCCYHVGKEFLEFFPEDVAQRDDGLYFDLVAVNKKQLAVAGVRNTNIFDSASCTSCQQGSFFSYRKEGELCGRMISVIMLK